MCSQHREKVDEKHFFDIFFLLKILSNLFLTSLLKSFQPKAAHFCFCLFYFSPAKNAAFHVSWSHTPIISQSVLCTDLHRNVPIFLSMFEVSYMILDGTCQSITKQASSTLTLKPKSPCFLYSPPLFCSSNTTSSLLHKLYMLYILIPWQFVKVKTVVIDSSVT